MFHFYFLCLQKPLLVRPWLPDLIFYGELFVSKLQSLQDGEKRCSRRSNFVNPCQGHSFTSSIPRLLNGAMHAHRSRFNAIISMARKCHFTENYDFNRTQ